MFEKHQYDIVLVIGELFFDHPMSGSGILKRLLEKYGYSVGIVEQPKSFEDVKSCGVPRLFFGVTSGAIDSMVRNYTPLKKSRAKDRYNDYDEDVSDRAVIVYCNWIKQFAKQVPIILGGTESTLRRFTHYDYWDNKLRRPILFDSRADVLVYGSGEKQVLEIASRINDNKPLHGISGTCEIVSQAPSDAVLLPSHEQVLADKESFVDLQRLFTNRKCLVQPVGNRFCLQHPSPTYTSNDLDEYYELPFTRKLPKKFRGFEFSIVTHRGCVGNCSFCALKLIQGEKIVSRSEDSIVREITALTKHPHFKGNVDDLGGPSANMYGMDCEINCEKNCIDCSFLNRSHDRALALLRRVRSIPGVKNVFIRSGIRYDLASKEYMEEVITKDHIYETLRIAPEHVSSSVLNLMNKNRGDLNEFIKFFNSVQSGKPNKKKLSYYFMTAHPGSTDKEVTELAKVTKKLGATDIQVFIPTPMTDSTCMYYTGLDLDKNCIYVPYTYVEKKEQKRKLY